MTRKIPKNLENPLDNYIISCCDKASGCYRKINFTPNGITTLSLICGILAILLFM